MKVRADIIRIIMQFVLKCRVHEFSTRFSHIRDNECDLVAMVIDSPDPL